jgi:hypothetical protein
MPTAPSCVSELKITIQTGIIIMKKHHVKKSYSHANEPYENGTVGAVGSVGVAGAAMGAAVGGAIADLSGIMVGATFGGAAGVVAAIAGVEAMHHIGHIHNPLPAQKK